ncbi:AraC family transcriptional regulator ligand-binding domain-containing protein [Cupriavidus basilensis]
MAYLVRSSALTDYLKVARSVGIDPYRFLRDNKIDPSALASDVMIPAGAVARLLEESAEAAGISDFGLRMVQSRRVVQPWASRLCDAGAAHTAQGARLGRPLPPVAQRSAFTCGLRRRRASSSSGKMCWMALPVPCGRRCSWCWGCCTGC